MCAFPGRPQGTASWGGYAGLLRDASPAEPVRRGRGPGSGPVTGGSLSGWSSRPGPHAQPQWTAPEDSPRGQPPRTVPDDSPHRQPQRTASVDSPYAQPQRTAPEDSPHARPQWTGPVHSPRGQPSCTAPEDSPCAQPQQVFSLLLALSQCSRTIGAHMGQKSFLEPISPTGRCSPRWGS